jgi:FkbM family methyltransferase
MKIFYGTLEKNIEVTNICFDKFKKDNKIYIPYDDCTRAVFFSDPLPGVYKSIFIVTNIIKEIKFANLIIHLDSNEIEIIDSNFVYRKISVIHNKLILKNGLFTEELPEQKMAVRFLNGNEKVLEIGGNIGRNSLIISSILNSCNNNNLVTLESDYDISKQLEENKLLNNLDFYIENSALSKKKLIQKEWETKQSDELLPGYKFVNTITFDELQNKYNIQFDTIIADCEGSLYYIFTDFPDILKNINMIIMENDYWEIEKKNFVDEFLIKNGFYQDYTEAGGWGPCYNFFYQTWKKAV